MESDRLKQLYSFLEQSPGDAFIQFAIAKEYENLAMDDQALTFYQKLLTTQAEYVGTYYHLGKLFERQEAFEKAFATYKQGMIVAKKAGDQHAFNELAGAKLGLGDDEDFE
ncbi:MAG: tetratricopeptide repeat protein [Saprospiraceae bacterium]